MRPPRFTIRQMMMLVAIVAISLVSSWIGPAIAAGIKRQVFAATDKFNFGTTNPGEGLQGR